MSDSPDDDEVNVGGADPFRPYTAGIRDMQHGHWAAFLMHCKKQGVTSREGMMRMIEDCIPKEFLDVFYGPGNPRRR